MLDAPYRDLSGRTPYLCQLHTHSTVSDGVDTPLAVVNAYKALGFDAVAITDHGLGDTGVPVMPTDPEVADILWIPGYEFSAGITPILGATNDMVVLNPDPAVPLIDGTYSNTPEPMVDAAMHGDVAFVAHPRNAGTSAYYGTNLTTTHADLITYRLAAGDGFVGVEGYFSYPTHGIGRLEGYGSDAKCFYDALEAGYRFGCAFTSDNHDISLLSNPLYQSGTVVYATALTIPAIMAALKDGIFYAGNASFSLTIVDTGEYLQVSVDGASSGYDISVWTAGPNCAAQVLDVSNYTWVYSGGERFVYMRVKNRTTGAVAWTNPTWIGDEHHKVSRAPRPRVTVRHAPLVAYQSKQRVNKSIRELSQNMFTPEPRKED